MYVYGHSRLRGIVAFDDMAILAELRWKCRRATPSYARRRRWYFGPVISRRLTTRGQVHARKRRITLSNVLAEKIRILKYERANTRVLTKFVKFGRAKNINRQDRLTVIDNRLNFTGSDNSICDFTKR